MAKIEKRNYALLRNLEDEIDALESFYDYSGGTYICDAISEIGDNFIPIYHSDIWQNVADIQEHIEEAIASGVVCTDSRNIDLMQIFQAGYYQFYTQSLYENLDILAFNYIVDRVNDGLGDLNRTTQESIDLSDLEDSIEFATENTDNNNKFSDLEDIAERIIKEINAGEFTL